MGVRESLGDHVKYVAFVWAYLECLGYSGILYGWGSLVYVLKDEGFYSDLCPRQEPDLGGNGTSDQTPMPGDRYNPSCDARDAMFNLIFTIASSILGVGIFLLGFVSLRFGTRITRLTVTVVFIIGSLCIAAASTDTPWLLFPGTSLIAVAGSGVIATNVQVTFLFPVWGSAAMSLISGSYDASAGVQLLVKVGHENNVSRVTSYYILTGVFLLTLINTFLLLPKQFVNKHQQDTHDVSGPEASTCGSSGKGAVEQQAEGNGEQPKEYSPARLSDVVASREFILHAFWFSLLHLRHVNYQATVNSLLEATLDSDDEVSEYTNAYLYILLSGVVVSFLPGFIYDYNIKVFKDNKSASKRRLLPSLFPLSMTSLLGVLLSTFSLFTDPTTLYIEFILIVFLRAFLYSTMCTYLRHLFPSELFTTLYGIQFLVAGLGSLLQNALFTWGDRHGDLQVHIFLIVLCLVTLAHPLYQWRQCQ